MRKIGEVEKAVGWIAKQKKNGSNCFANGRETKMERNSNTTATKNKVKSKSEGSEGWKSGRMEERQKELENAAPTLR